MDGYVSKPFEAEQLYREVSKFFKSSWERIYKAVLNQTMEGSASSLGRRCEYIGSKISS
jgi:predicted NAD-dependent protein-ADP-ribosyltransferase YbiA (DUF1768 family)